MDISNKTSRAQQPVIPTPSVNASNSKLIPIILGVAAVIIIAIAAYVLGTKQSQPVVQNIVQTTPISSPTPDPTENWETYTNTKYGYSIKYPNDWTIKSENSPVDSVTTKTQLQSKNFVVAYPTMGGGVILGSETGTLLEIKVSKNPNFKSYEELKNFEETESTQFPLNYFSSTSEVQIGGMKAVKNSGGKPYKGVQNYACTFNNGVAYEIYLTSFDNQEVLFDQILSTLQFTP